MNRALVGIFLLIVSLVYAGELAAQERAELYKSMFAPLPEKAANPDNPLTDAKVKLGKALYFETRLSKANDISCNSCHDLGTFGVDNKPVSAGHQGQTGDRNSPTVYNAALHTTQFWDGRAKDVEEQALGPILNPVEMAMSADVDVIKRLKDIPGYVKLFKEAFPQEADPVTFENIGKAIGTFERTLLTPSRFDKYLQGDQSALTEKEKKGLETFVKIGCTTCHIGAPVGGIMFQKLGLLKPYPTKDLGRYQVTKKETDKYFFKVPSLRNIEKTGPYFHDGSIETLEESIKIMAEYQLGQTLSDQQIGEIMAFLKALTGEIPQTALEKPDLPE